MGTDDRNGSMLPRRTSALPVRTTRSRRAGRHSSPHQLSVPPEAPALVIAVPGAATEENRQLTAEIATSASASCPGIPVLPGYLEGQEDHLSTVLAGLRDRGGRPAVMVPLLAGPLPWADTALAALATEAGIPVLVAGHLGPHPLLAEALHARLSGAGLARAARAARLSIVAEADGVIVGAVGDDDAVQGAGVVAVLLASRLTAPVAPARLTDPASVAEAAARLRSAEVRRIALAPCVIGPEITPGTLDSAISAAGLTCAPPLGSHPAIAKLVAMRYGAALENPRLADLVS